MIKKIDVYINGKYQYSSANYADDGDSYIEFDSDYLGKMGEEIGRRKENGKSN